MDIKKIHVASLVFAFFFSMCLLAQPVRAAEDIVFEDEGFTVPDSKEKKAVKFKDSKKTKAASEETKKAKEDKAETKDVKKSADKKADKDNSKAEEEENFELISGLNDKFAQIAEQGKVSEKTQQKFLKLQIAQEQSLEKFDKKSQPVIARYEKKISREDDEKRQKKYQAKIDAITVQRAKLERKYEFMALKLLSKEENARRNSTMLWNAISPDLTMLNASDEQLDKARKICDEMAAKSRRPLLPETVDKASLQVSKKLVKSVLDKQQGKEYKRFIVERLRENRR